MQTKTTVNHKLILFCTAASLICLLIIIFFLPSIKVRSVFGSAPTETGKLIVRVEDGMSAKPLAGARVVVAETGKSYITDANGKTETITVPILRNENMSKVLPQPWGEITLIVYADGYLPYVLVHGMILPDQTRNGPDILMFRKENAESGQPFTIVEAPNKLWVNELIKKFE